MMIRTLTKEEAERYVDSILGIGAEGWTRDHLLLDLPDKWTLSFAAWPGPMAYAILSRKPTGVHLHHFVVAPNEREHGVGAIMIKEAIRRAGDSISLKVFRNNNIAIRFYKSHSFEIIDERGEYISMIRHRR